MAQPVEQWDDGFFRRVKQIKLSYGKVEGDGISFFQATYEDHDGNTIVGHPHGNTRPGDTSAEIVIDNYPEEQIVHLSGYTGHSDLLPCGAVAVRSLKFKTNKKPYEPFGAPVSATDKPFNYDIQNGFHVVGFKGANGKLLSEIELNRANAKN